MRRASAALLTGLLSVLLGGCDWHWPWAAHSDKPDLEASQAANNSGGSVGPPLGGVPGGLHIEGEPNMANPLSGKPQSVADGRRLYLAMNCASCHGYDATGGMGPNLTDKQWRYAGTPAALFNSISQGRPQGMPSWGRTLPPGQIWALVAYLQTLGGTYQPGQYNASLEGDTDATQVAPGYAVLEKVTSSLAPPAVTADTAAQPAAPGLKQ